MNLAPRKVSLLSKALARAWELESASVGCATAGDVVFRALQEAVHTLSRLPENDRVSGLKSRWLGFTLSPEEREESYRQLVWLVLSGQASPDELITPAPVSVDEIGQMEVVLDVFRSLLVGRQIGRDWKILTLLARGRTSHEIGRQIGRRLTRAAISDRKQVQCGAIAAKLLQYMPVQFHVAG